LPRQARDNPYYRKESTQKRTAFELLQEVTEDERKALVELLPVYQDYMQQNIHTSMLPRIVQCCSIYMYLLRRILV
jgi:isoleucyl-tRNA synthetase